MNKELYIRLLRMEKNCKVVPEPLLLWEAIEPLLPFLKLIARQRASPDRSGAAELVTAHADRIDSPTNLSSPALKLLLQEVTALAVKNDSF